MSQLASTALSVLDLAPIRQGGNAAETFRDSVSLAQHTESLGYQRYWLAEHHNIAGIASAATAVLIGHVAGQTSTIRVGSGGIMLPNHPPLVIAEQFGTLESLYPGRIDLGLGRAPGTDGMTAQALRRGRTDGEDPGEKQRETEGRAADRPGSPALRPVLRRHRFDTPRRARSGSVPFRSRDPLSRATGSCGSRSRWSWGRSGTTRRFPAAWPA